MKLKAAIAFIIFLVILTLPFLVNAANGDIFKGVPKPEFGSAASQYGIDMNYMRNHMNILKQEGQSTKQCLSCHTNRADFCDRCHGYVGIKPSIQQ